MNRRLIMATVFGVGFLGLPIVVGLASRYAVPRDDDDDDDNDSGQQSLAQALRYTRTTLQQGLTASEELGQPISGKFEVGNRKFQLSVYTSKGGKFSEVLVDLSNGKVANVEPLSKADDLANARTQTAAMANAKRSLKEAVEKASGEFAGFRAVGVIPNPVTPLRLYCCSRATNPSSSM
jgi:hypothetical protein